MDRLQGEPCSIGGVINKIVARAGLLAALRLITKAHFEENEEKQHQYMNDADRILTLILSIGVKS